MIDDVRRNSFSRSFVRDARARALGQICAQRTSYPWWRPRFVCLSDVLGDLPDMGLDPVHEEQAMNQVTGEQQAEGSGMEATKQGAATLLFQKSCPQLAAGHISAEQQWLLVPLATSRVEAQLHAPQHAY
eukprot:1157795-Pelagomonas_calceolata.AAC.1